MLTGRGWVLSYSIVVCYRLESEGLVLAVDIKNAFALHPTLRLNKEHLSNGSRQVSFFWVCKLGLQCIKCPAVALETEMSVTFLDCILQGAGDCSF